MQTNTIKDDYNKGNLLLEELLQSYEGQYKVDVLGVGKGYYFVDVYEDNAKLCTYGGKELIGLAKDIEKFLKGEEHCI